MATPNPDRPSPLRALYGALLGWAPIWIPLVILAQIGLLGLKPALLRRASLDELTPQVEFRLGQTLAEHTYLRDQVRGWEEDPLMFQARYDRAGRRPAIARVTETGPAFGR